MNTLNIFKVLIAVLLTAASVCQAVEGTWTRKADMPTARAGLSASVVDGNIYAIGGGPTSVPTTIVERYDPEIDSWTTKSSMQTARAFFGSATVNGRVYAIGGYGYEGVGAFLASVEEYNPVTDTWRPRADMPTKRSWLCVSALNGKIYAIGGVLNTAEATGTVEAYDPVANAWMPKADMPTQRGGAAAASVDGKIYVIGGAVGDLHNHPLSIVEAYDPVTDTWTRKADMPTARMILAVSVVCGKIYAIGGYDFLGPIYATVEVYDPATNTWTNMPDMHYPRKALISAAVNGKIYAMGGQPVAGWNAPISVVEEYNLIPPPDFNGDGMVNIKDLLRLIGSWNQDDSLLDIAPPPFGDGIVDALDLELLMNYWEEPFDDVTLIAHWALDETEGMFSADSAGSNDAIVLGGYSWQPSDGQVDGALQLDGISGYAITNPIFNPADGLFSIIAWIKGGAPGQVVVSQQNMTNWLATDSEGNLMTELTSSDPIAEPLLSETVVTDGQWHRIGHVWDGLHRRLYVDDILVAEDTQANLQDSDGGLYIGTGKAMEPGTCFSGLIDDVRIYNRAVSP